MWYVWKVVLEMRIVYRYSILVRLQRPSRTFHFIHVSILMNFVLTNSALQYQAAQPLCSNSTASDTAAFQIPALQFCESMTEYILRHAAVHCQRTGVAVLADGSFYIASKYLPYRAPCYVLKV
jgi:hypothetical protein